MRAGSAATIAHFGGNLHPDFGSNPSYGIPFTIVAADQPPVPVTFDAVRRPERPGPVPDPARTRRSRRAATPTCWPCQQGTCLLYELFAASAGRRRLDGGLRAPAGTCAPTRLRPEGWTSADAAGLPILPGLLRYDEVASGQVTHAIRMTFSETYAGHIHPATHDASSNTDPTLPPMGLRLRLRADFDLRAVHRRRAGDPRGDAALRRDRGRQRLELVLRRRHRLPVGRRGPRSAEAGARARRSRWSRRARSSATPGSRPPRAAAYERSSLGGVGTRSPLALANCVLIDPSIGGVGTGSSAVSTVGAERRR